MQTTWCGIPSWAPRSSSANARAPDRTRKLLGSDRDAGALEVARANLEACGAERFTLFRGDARSSIPRPPPTLVITNPPMGRRVLRNVDLGELIDAFVSHVAHLLAPGARMVWMSPLAGSHGRDRDAARALGIACGSRSISVG